ncbi:MAG: Cof-type HAD-IIB family hydrolase [Caulobacteraceae bacterium]
MAEARDIRLALVDVDGTLVTQDKVLTAAALDAVKALRAAGIALAITSGRPPRGMTMLVGPLALDTPIAGFNGGVFVGPDMSVIESHTLDPAVARKALKIIADKGLDTWLYTADDWFIHDKDAPHVARETWTVKFEARVVKDFAPADLDKAVKIVGVSDDLDLVAECETAVQAALGDKASAARSQPYYLDVTHPLANKGTVVSTLARMRGLEPRQIATFGDMPNDVLMFVKSGFSVAMGNAGAEVKAKASAITDSNENDGFAKAVRRYLLAGDTA